MRTLFTILLCAVTNISIAIDLPSRKEPKADTDSIPYFNEYMLGSTYNDIAQYVSADNKWGYGLGVYHHSNMRNGFTTRWGMELTVNRFYGHLAGDHHRGMYRYSKMDAAIGFFSIPLSLSYHFGKRYRIAPEVGMHMDFNLSAMGKGTYTYVQLNSGGDPPSTIHNKEVHLSNVNIRRFNLGPHAGISMYIPLGKNELILRGEYRFGLIDLSQLYYTSSIYNRYFRFSAGYGFGMKQKTSNTKPNLFFNELRVSTHYDFKKHVIDNAYSGMQEFKTIPGFGIGIFHITKPLRRFQYQIGIDFNRTHLFAKSEYHSHVEGTVNTRTNSHRYLLALANAVRYSLTEGKTRPFVQLGLAPELNFLKSSRFVTETTKKIDGSIIGPHNSRLAFSESRNVFINISAGVGCAIATDNRDYILLTEYIMNNNDYFTINGKGFHSSYLKLSLGITLGARK
jgi:hypothetical protein